jgi:hypothetical protein
MGSPTRSSPRSSSRTTAHPTRTMAGPGTRCRSKSLDMQMETLALPTAPLLRRTGERIELMDVAHNLLTKLPRHVEASLYRLPTGGTNPSTRRTRCDQLLSKHAARPMKTRRATLTRTSTTASLPTTGSLTQGSRRITTWTSRIRKPPRMIQISFLPSTVLPTWVS